MADGKTQTPASTGHLPLEDRFRIWFEKNSKQVILGCVVVILVAGVVIYWFWKSSSTETAASEALAKANTPEELLQVTATYPNSKSAPLALLLVADDYFTKGKHKEAQGIYERFLQQYPRHEMADSAQYGIASCLEAQSDIPKAVAGYESLQANYPNSFHLAAARVAMARCAERQGDLQKAKQFLEDIMASMPGSPWQQEAQTRLALLSRKLQPTAPEQPSIPSLILPPTTGTSPSPAPGSLPTTGALK